MGKPSTYSHKAADEICARISDGEPLRQICRDEHMPSWRTVYRWMEAREDFASRIARARDLGFDAIAEEALLIADTPALGEERTESENGVTVKTLDMLGHRKLQIETRLKLLAKWSPKKFGEKVLQEISGADGGPVQFDDRSAAAKLAALLAVAEARKQSKEGDEQ